MKLALHRSLSFWSGLLVMGFVCWAWWDSMHPRVPKDVPWGRISNYQGGLCIDYRCPYMAQDFGMGRAAPWQWQTEVLPKPYFLSRDSLKREDFNSTELRIYSGKPFSRKEWMWLALDGVDSSAWRLFVPHWLILLAVALPWSALLLWRTRRRVAATRLSPAFASPTG